jgi:hypothetical protein
MCVCPNQCDKQPERENPGTLFSGFKTNNNQPIMKMKHLFNRQLPVCGAAGIALMLLASPQHALAQGTWSTKAPIPAGGNNVAAAAVNGIVYVAGGNNGAPMANLQAYNVTNNAWTSLAALPGVRYQNDGMAVISNKLYYPGGWTYSPALPNNNLWVYDPVLNSWTSKAAMPLLSGNGASGVISNLLYVTTPDNGYNGYYSFLHVYNPASDSWTQLANSPRPHAGAAAGVLGNKFYVAGGFDGANITNILDVYDPASNTWSTKSSMHSIRYNPGSAVINGYLYVYGGSGPSGNYLNSVEYYNPANDTWTLVNSMPTSRDSAGTAVANGITYVAGGANTTNSYLTTVEAFTVTTPPPVYQGVTFLGAAGSDLTGSGIKFNTNAVYVCANNSAASGLLASFATPLVTGGGAVWNATWPDSNPVDQFYGITATSSGLYAAGPDYTRTTDTVGGKEVKGLMLKFPFNGATGSGYEGDIWDNQIPAPPGAYSYGGGEALFTLGLVVENGTNFIYTAGGGQPNGIVNASFFISKVTESGTVLWTQTQATGNTTNSYGEAVAGYNTNVYVGGLFQSIGSGIPYPALWKYSSAGSLVWNTIITNSGSYNGIAILGTNLYAVGGTGAGSPAKGYVNQGAASDFLIAEWDLNGNQIWSRTYPRGAQSLFTAIINVNGRLFASGYTRGQTQGGADAVLVEIDPATGNLLSTNYFGGPLDDEANGLDSDGTNVYVVGQSRSFGSGSSQVMVLQYSLASQGPVLTNLVVTPANATVAVSGYKYLTATGYYSDGSSGLLGTTNGLVWASSTSGVATINYTNGLAFGLTPGATLITASVGNIINSNLLTVVTPPTITTNPVSETVAAGGSLTLNVSATGGGLAYQWNFNGTAIPGATGASYVINNFAPGYIGDYSVTVSNAAGSVTSRSVTVGSVGISLFAGVMVDGPLGSNYLIQASSTLATNWTTLTNVALPTQPYIYIDYTSPTNRQQFYRALPQ